MKIGVFTDPHLGKALSANTTLASRKRLRDDLYNHVKDIMTHDGVDVWLCLGDLLDRYQNNEAVLLQASEIAGNCDLLMAGNHDVVNDSTRIGTMQVLEQFLDKETICRAEFGEVKMQVFGFGLCDFYVVPHHSGEDLFEAALERAVSAAVDGPDHYSFLLLHCNYNMEFASNDVTLNLSRQRAEKLLDTFDHIMIGHDHHPKEDFDGRVIVLGNTHPTGFGDITDKRIAMIDSDTGKVTFKEVWNAADSYAEVDVQDLLAANVTESHHLTGQFIDIKGTMAAEQAMDFAKLMKHLWNAERTPYAIRANIHLQKAGVELADDAPAAENAWEIIRGELKEAGRQDLLDILDGLKVAKAEMVLEE